MTEEMPHGMGKADWLWAEELQMHLPCCIVRVKRVGVFGDTVVKCGNGPLTGDRILTGDCGEHDRPVP